MNRTKRLFTVLLVVLLALMPCSQVHAASKDKITISVYQNYGKAQEVLKLINKERKKRGLSALKMDKRLTKHAITRSAELCVMVPWTSPHMRPNGARNSDTDSVVYECCQERGIGGEDPSPKAVVKDWMSSPSHKAGILLSYAQSVGIAFVQTDEGRTGHYVLEFSADPANSVEKSTKKKFFNVKVKSKRKYLSKKAFSMKVEYTYSDYDAKTPGMYIRTYIDTKKSIGEYYVSSSNFKFKSSNTSVATISKKGKITPVSPGKVTFTVTYKSNPKIKKKIKYTITQSDLE